MKFKSDETFFNRFFKFNSVFLSIPKFFCYPDIDNVWLEFSTFFCSQCFLTFILRTKCVKINETLYSFSLHLVIPDTRWNLD